MITTYIAKEIAPEYRLTLEQNAKKSIEKAGGVGQGNVSKSTQRKLRRGRFDIVVWKDGDTPAVIIEVKKQPLRFSDKNGIKDDVDNICKVLKGKNSLQYGLIAYYSAWAETDDESADKRTSRIVAAIRCEAEAHIKKRWGLKLIQYPSHPKPKVVRDSAWIGVVLKISA